MAVRGGRGGNPEAFGGGAGEGAGSGSGRATTGAASTNPHEGFDYEGEWGEHNPPIRSKEPKQVGMTDAEGLEKFRAGTPEYFNAVHNNRRWAAWSAARGSMGISAKESANANRGDQRPRRLKPEQKASFQGVRLENPTKHSEFFPILDRHAATIRSMAAGLNAVADRDGRPGRKSPLDAGTGIAAAAEQAKKMIFAAKGKHAAIREAAKAAGDDLINTAKKRAESARIKLTEANNHLADYATHRMRGDDFQKGTNRSGLNPTLMRSATAEANKHYRKAAHSLHKAHLALTHDDVTATLGYTPAGIGKDDMTDMLNKADKLPVPKQQGKAVTRFQFGGRGFERVLRHHLAEAGIKGDEAEQHVKDFRHGNIKVGSPVHKILIEKAQDYADRTGDRAPLEKLQSALKPVRRLTKAEKNVVKTKKIGFGSLAGGTKTVEAMQESERQAEAVGQGGQGTGVQGALDSTDHGIDTRVRDPKKGPSISTRTDRVGAAPIAGPTIGKNVSNVGRATGRGRGGKKKNG